VRVERAAAQPADAMADPITHETPLVH